MSETHRLWGCIPGQLCLHPQIIWNKLFGDNLVFCWLQQIHYPLKTVFKDKRFFKRDKLQVPPWQKIFGVALQQEVCESSSGLLKYMLSLSEGDKSVEMVEGRGVNKAARLIWELAARCVTASWTPERAVTCTRTAGQKDTDCSVCSPDIVHIWYGTLAPNSLLTPLPFTLYYFMLMEKY